MLQKLAVLSCTLPPLVVLLPFGKPLSGKLHRAALDRAERSLGPAVTPVDDTFGSMTRNPSLVSLTLSTVLMMREYVLP